MQNETIWLAQQKIADLFGVERSVITKHLKNVFQEGELIKEATCAKFAQVQFEGEREVSRNIEFYNLDAIISVGYRVNDSSKENMGLTTWKNAPKGSIRITDIGIAKNYLNEKELDGLNRIVSMYLDYAENQAQKGVVMFMKDWVSRLDAFLKFNEEAVLNHQGKVSHDVASALAENEFEKYRIIKDRLMDSDFDQELKKLNK